MTFLPFLVKLRFSIDECFIDATYIAERIAATKLGVNCVEAATNRRITGIKGADRQRDFEQQLRILCTDSDNVHREHSE